MSANLYERLIGQGPDAGRTAIETADGRCWSFSDIAAESARFANLIAARGVKPGDRVAVQVEKSVENLILYLATLRAGAVHLPLNTGYTLNELGYFLGDAEPALVVCDPAQQAGVAALARGARVETLGRDGEGSLVQAAAAETPAFDTVPRADDDLAAILYTSGTTGRSKGAMLTHANLAVNAATLVAAWRFTAADVLLHALPIYHTHGLFVAVNVALMARSAMMVLPKFDESEILRLMPRATVMMGVPTFYTRLLAHPGLTREAAAHMRLFTSGSAPLLADTHRAWERRTGHAILERYGMTETGMNTSNPYDGPRVPGTVGPPLPGVSARIVDTETGRPLGAGEIGMIEVKGPNVFTGYWRMPDKTAAEFRSDGFFITGDLGLIDLNGYVHIVGRGKDLIISGGLNVYPKEVESAIDAIAGVAESAVIGLPHADFGEGVTAVVVPVPGAAIDEHQVLAALGDRLARFKQPKRVVFVEALPRNAMGKVQKNALRARYAGLYRPDAPPQSANLKSSPS